MSFAFADDVYTAASRWFSSKAIGKYCFKRKETSTQWKYLRLGDGSLVSQAFISDVDPFDFVISFKLILPGKCRPGKFFQEDSIKARVKSFNLNGSLWMTQHRE